MLRPLTMFCCGFAPATGVYIVMACHFLLCLAQLVAVCSNVIWETTLLFEFDSKPLAIFIAGFTLVGLLLVSCAIYGMIKRIEVTLRCYLYYLFLCFAIETSILVYTCLWKDVCELEAFTDFADGDAGESFMCGIARISSYLLVAVIVSLEVYVLFLVWSMAETIHQCSEGQELSHLMLGKEDAVKKNRRPVDGPYAGIVGFANSKVPGPYPFTEKHPYGATVGMPAQPSIFGGTEHDMSYPPAKPVSIY